VETKPISYYLALVLLVLSAALAVANLYLQPQRPAAPAVALLLVGAMALALFRASRRRPGGLNDDETPRNHAADSIRNGVVSAALIVVFSLGAKIAATLGASPGGDLSWRATMAIMGAFLVFTGNAIPKTLAPLTAMRDPARVQAIQRLAGWAWVLTGLALAIAWLMFPLAYAEPLTLFLLPSAMLISAAQLFRLRRTRQKPA